MNREEHAPLCLQTKPGQLWVLHKRKKAFPRLGSPRVANAPHAAGKAHVLSGLPPHA